MDLFPHPHPILPPHTQEDAATFFSGIRRDQSRWEKYIEWWNARQQQIADADPETGDPYRYGFQLGHWHHADLALGRLLKTDSNLAPTPSLRRMAQLLSLSVDALRLPPEVLDYLPRRQLVLLGGNRSGKSEYCAHRVVCDAMATPGSLIVCGAESEESSIMTQQSLIWKYLPRELKALKGKKDSAGIFHINYDLKGGFTLMKIILPNRSRIVFKTYNQDWADCEGWMLGNPDTRIIGAWLDESATLAAMETASRRTGYYNANVLWSYTPVKGMTQPIRQYAGEACPTLMSLPAELLPPHRRYVPDCPPGHMPYIAKSTDAETLVMYFFTVFNPFGSSAGSFYSNLKRMLVGKTEQTVCNLAYGRTKDSAHRAFPKFGPHNIVPMSKVPAKGTDFMFLDPAGSRNCFCIWVRVVGDPPRYFIYRDWPDAATYGDWAVPHHDPDVHDGAPGPAQKTLGMGWRAYKKLWRTLESKPIHLQLPPPCIPNKLDPNPPPPQPSQPSVLSELSTLNPQPSTLCERYIDPRAARDQRVVEEGGTCPIDELAKDDTEPDPANPGTSIIIPGMVFTPAKGLDRQAGIAAINQLLDYNDNEPICSLVNEPKLYVGETCQQVIWCLANDTASAHEKPDKAACKDVEDTLRYMATADLYDCGTGALQCGAVGTYS